MSSRSRWPETPARPIDQPAVSPPAVSPAFVPAADEALPRLYGRGIAGCRARDAAAVGQVLMQLIGALDFEYEAAATRLFEVYDECLERVAREQFALPQRVLEGLQRACGPGPRPAISRHPRA